MKLGDSDAVRVGDWVMAVGNPFGLSHTVTQGIISAKGRVIGAGPYDNFLQTDASINPGNSGGPLLNLSGEVVGINTAILASGQGIGFATPSNMAKSVIPQLKEKGKVIRGMIGVQVQNVTPELAKSFGLPEPKGALVAEVFPDSPADKAGIHRGDIIIEFNGHPIHEMNDLPRLVADTAPGTKATVKVLREGKEKDLTMTITELKEEKQAAQAKEEGAGEEAPLGLVVKNIDPNLAKRFRLRDTKGALVVGVEQGSVAADAGIRPGDLLLEVDGQVIGTAKDFHDRDLKAEEGVYRPLPDQAPGPHPVPDLGSAQVTQKIFRLFRGELWFPPSWFPGRQRLFRLPNWSGGDRKRADGRSRRPLIANQ